MARTLLRFVTVTVLLSLAGAVLGDGKKDRTLQEIAKYREWGRLNEKPMPVTFGGDLGG
jgi:hypothetical protein